MEEGRCWAAERKEAAQNRKAHEQGAGPHGVLVLQPEPEFRVQESLPA